MLNRIVAGALCLTVFGCSDNEAAAPNPLDVNVEIPETVQTSSPRYDEREGDIYFYVADVSEEDRKAGRATGDVMGFKYLGTRDGVHLLQQLDSDGRATGVSECGRPCKVIKSTWIDGDITRTGFNANSVIGAAFEDAFNGHLTRATGYVGSAKTPPTSSAREPTGNAITIPAAFLGEWNEDLGACGTAQNDTRLRVEPRLLRFYESDAEVRAVAVLTDRAIRVDAVFSGDGGEVWTRSMQMVLSRGDNLSIDGVGARKRCP